MIVYSEAWKSYGVVIQKDTEFIINGIKIYINVILIIASSDKKLIGMMLGSRRDDRIVDGLMLE